MSQEGNYGVAMAFIFLALALLVLFVVVLWGVSPAKSEELSGISVRNASYCALVSREMVFIDVMHGEPITADTDVILARAKAHYADCLAVLPALMPLPADIGSLKAWLADIRDVLVLRGAERVASIGTVPASENPDDAAWREACAAKWRTFDPVTLTVVRPNSEGKPVRCPLVLRNGAWEIAE